MNRTGYRRGVPIRFENGDLARKAVVVGAVLAAAVVFFAALTAVWGPSGPQPRPSNGVASFLGWQMAKKSGKSSSAKSSDDDSDSDSDDGSDSDSNSDRDSDHDSGGKKKGGGSSKKSGASSKNKSSSADSDTDSDSGPLTSRSSSAAPGIGPSGRSSPSTTGTATTGATQTATRTAAVPSGPAGSALAQVSCTKQVTDEAGLRDALASAGANDVICVKGNIGRSSAASPTPTPSAAPPSGPSTSSRAPGPISLCGADATCTQTNRSSGSSARSTATPSSSADRPSARSSVRPSPSSSSGTSSSPTGTAGSSGEEASPASTGGPPGAATPAQDNCSKQVDGSGLSQAVAAASPGERICVTGDIPDRLEVKKSGTEQAPIQIIGNGQSVVKGITVDASHVLVEGFQVLDAKAPGIQVTGDDITVRNNTVKRPTGDDYDGLRFFGNNIKILHNTISDINPGSTDAHADCMQTFTSDRPSSEDVVIDGNKCEKIKNICVMAEGPGDVGDGGGGDGTSANWTISNNYCEFGASQGIMIEAVQNVTIKNNEFAGNADKAIGLDIGSTGATVSANLLDDGVKADVGMDTTSKKGYQGPQPQGGP
jgi:hypothetical protein